MKPKFLNGNLIVLAMLAATLAFIAAFPTLQKAQAIANPANTNQPLATRHRVEVVFVLDTTGSMGGLIHAAREKIWSIATSMASASQNPEIRMGLVAYRDRGDDYVTRVIDLSSDLDSMYTKLMDFRAGGGGDAPESVNQALHDAIHDISWSEDDATYRVLFLIGDAPPHMDYPDDVKYPQTLALAQQKGIVVNAIQSGVNQRTRPAWEHIAALGQGAYFQVENTGNAVAIATPYDEKLSRLAAQLEDTRLFYGDEKTRLAQQKKLEANARLRRELSSEALARRDTFNSTASGRANLLTEQELVTGVTSGDVDLESIATEDLPANLRSMTREEQQKVIEDTADKREALQSEIKALAESRQQYIKEKLDAEGGAADSLDEQIYRAVREQGAAVGLSYDSDGTRY